MIIRKIFEEELTKRGVKFSIDEESGRHVVFVNGGRSLVSLQNLERDVEKDNDRERISQFVDSVIASASMSGRIPSADQIYWSIEPNDYVDKANFRVALSDQVDRVLVHFCRERGLITWVTLDMLQGLGLSESDAGMKAFTNLARALTETKIETQEMNGVKVAFLTTPLPFKASLILAPNLKEFLGPVLGWPLMAVIPDRDFLYIWAARHADFVGRVGGVVVREYTQASYPISTEVYELSDKGIKAIGAFPKTDENEG
jgi:hypothetical protein